MTLLMTNLEYDGQVLANTRREQKLKVDDIATELCLSVQQVEAIENNLGALFHSNELKKLICLVKFILKRQPIKSFDFI